MSLEQTLCEKCQNANCSQAGNYNAFFSSFNTCSSYDSGEPPIDDDEDITQTMDDDYMIDYSQFIPYI